MVHHFDVNGERIEVHLTHRPEGWSAQIADREYQVVGYRPGHLRLADHRSLDYGFAHDPQNPPGQIELLGSAVTVRRLRPGQAAQDQGPSDGTVRAPMNGQVVKVLRRVGEALKRGEVVLVLEAMKMENEVAAPADGTLTGLEVTPGQTVAPGDLLFRVTSD